MAESLTFRIGADTQGFADGINGMIGKLAGLVAAFLGAQSVIEAFGSAIDLGGRLNELSTRTGETAGNLAILERAFENTEVGASKVGPAIAKMQDSIVSASDESSKAAAAFTKLGLSFDDLDGKSPTEQLELIGQRLTGIGDPAQRAAIAIDIFGKAGTELLPVLMNFGSELDEAKRQLGSLPAMLDNSAGAIDRLGDNLAAIKNKGTEMAYGFLNEVIPAVNGFVESLAGADAASLGAGLAQALVGAFVQPMAAASLMGDAIALGAKKFGNEFIYGIQYGTELLLNTFTILGASVIPLMGKTMQGAFEMAVGAFGTLLIAAITPVLESLRGVANFLGFGEVLDATIAKVQGVQGLMDKILADGFDKIETSSAKFNTAMAEAQNKSTVVRQDFLGAEGAAADIESRFAAIQAAGKATADSFKSIFSPTGGSIAEFGQGPIFPGGGVAPLPGMEPMLPGSDLPMDGTFYTDHMAAIDKVAAGTVGVFKTVEKSAAQLAAELQKQLGIIAAINPNQASGQSQAAQEVLDDQQKLAALEAAGKGNTAAANNLREQIASGTARAQGIGGLTAEEQRAAQSEAFEEFFGDNPDGKTMEDLIAENMEEALAEKRAAGKEQQEEDKKKAEQKEEDKKPKTIQGVADSMLKLLQKIEPRIPTYNLA
jgi:hypothetical protein